MASNELQRERSVLWLPAALLILVQVIVGVRDLPQMAFFVIYLNERLHLSTVTISGIAGAAQIVGMLTALAGGTIANRIGSKWMIACGLALSGLGSLAFQAASPVVAAGLWFISGAGMALTTVGSASYLTQISARGRLGILAAFFALSMTAGGALGNPLAGFVIERYGYAAISWVAVGITVAVVLVVTLMMSNLRSLDGETVGVGEKPPAHAPGREILAAARLASVRYLVVLRCLPTIFYGLLLVLVPLLLNELSGSKALVAAYGTTNLIIASAAQLVAGRAADRWGARRPTQVAYSVMILSGLGLALVSGKVWGVFAFGVVGIAAAWSLSTLMYLWVNDGVAKANHPITFGLLHAVWSLSMTAGSLLSGLSAITRPGLPFLVAGLVNIASLFLIVGYYRGRKPDLGR
jgi:MFS family permease